MASGMGVFLRASIIVIADLMTPPDPRRKERGGAKHPTVEEAHDHT
jgi:hypothetical protein